MKHDRISSARPSEGGSPRAKAELRIALRGELEGALALAPRKDQPLWRWLLELADDSRLPPLWSGQPNISEMVRDMGVKRHSAERFAKTVAEWLPRFSEAFGTPPEDAFPDQALAAARNGSGVDGDEDLAEALATEREKAPERKKLVYTWLIAHAEAGAPLPMNGARVNLRQVGRDMKVGYSAALAYGEILNRWAPRFAGTPVKPLQRRNTLPGVERSGTDVPTNTLIEALEEAIGAEANDDAVKVLRHLLHLASNGRVVPRSHAQPHLMQLLRDAQVEDLGLRTPARKVLDDWVEFFKLDDFVTTTGIDGTSSRRPVIAVRVKRFIDELQADPANPIPLLRDKRSHGPSFAWIGRELQISSRSIAVGEPGQLIRAYWDKVPGDQDYEGRTLGEALWRQARRAELLPLIKARVAAGDALPAKATGRKVLDHDELIRLLGSPGHTLCDDATFRKAVTALKPRLERVGDTGGVPENYGQLIAAVQSARAKGVAAGSVASTRSTVERAIRLFYKWHGKSETHPISTDFDEPSLAETMKEMEAEKACGTQPQNWRTEMRFAKRWLDARISDDMLGDEFDVVLLGAVQKDGRLLPDLLEGIDLEPGQVTDWMRGESLPTKESLGELSRLEAALKLKERRLVDLVEKGARSSGKPRAGIKIPPGVREFLPDDWTRRSAEEQIAMIEWIDANIVHQNSVYGRTMRDVAKRSHAKRRAARLGDAAVAAATTSAEREPEAPNAEEAAQAPATDAAGKWIDRQLTPETTGLPARVVDELRSLRKHMTVNFPTRYLRRRRSKWEDRSTAPMKMGMLVRFLRWQTLPIEDGGLGRDPDHLTLGDIVHPPLVFAYVDYKARALEHVEHNDRRRGKVFTSTEVDLLRTLKSLVSREFGFVTQHEDYAARIVRCDDPLDEGSFISLEGHVYDKEDNRAYRKAEREGTLDEEPTPDVMPMRMCGLEGEAWIKACRRAELAYDSAAEVVDQEADMIRDPAEAIQPILDSPRPMATLLRQIALAGRKEPDVRLFPLQHHMHKRDLLMARLLALTTLRNRNVREITVTGPAPKLRFDKAKKMWVLEIPSREFKNWRNVTLFGRARKRQAYKKWLKDTRDLYDLLTYYLEVSRPWFIAKGIKSAKKRGRKYTSPNELFLSSRGKALDGPELWRCMRKFTSRHVAWNPFREEGIPLCQPFGIHAFRDIRATDILLNPETANPYLEAAFALQTSPGMIQHHYGIVKTEKRTEQDDVSFHKREDEAWAVLA